MSFRHVLNGRTESEKGMVKVELDFNDVIMKGDGVHVNIKGLKPINDLEIVMCINSLISAYADARKMSYDSAKLECMTKIIEVEKCSAGMVNLDKEAENDKA